MGKKKASPNLTPKTGGLRNRIIERCRMDASQITPNPRNWREHPQEQQLALQGILDEVGQVGELYVYRSVRNGGKLTLIDGHLRTEIGGEWDVAITDLDDAEADKLLLAYDPVSAMATANKNQLDALMRDVQSSNAGLIAMLEGLAVENGIIGEVGTAMLPELPSGAKEPFQQMTFTCHDSQIEMINVALNKAKQEGPFDGPNENSNGNALARICEAYNG